ncbi:hypothetical protein ONZ51_g12390 [Trametes cubensis]|uniref:Retrotransposon gag domain-containing protein n=1 Tax=Trametes cubensis TaxID=1111947 RepID=A0AAD7X4N0_9APHY|nr:hypothetical protein ONZ51_g12390 [Trametes cubensis]
MGPPLYSARVANDNDSDQENQEPIPIPPPLAERLASSPPNYTSREPSPASSVSDLSTVVAEDSHLVDYSEHPDVNQLIRALLTNPNPVTRDAERGLQYFFREYRSLYNEQRELDAIEGNLEDALETVEDALDIIAGSLAGDHVMIVRTATEHAQGAVQRLSRTVRQWRNFLIATFELPDFRRRIAPLAETIDNAAPPPGELPAAAQRARRNNSPRDLISDEWMERFGYVVRIHGFCQTPMLSITDNRAINHILTNYTSFTKPEFIRLDLSKLLCEGLVTAEGEKYRHQRRILNQVFGSAQTRKAASTFFDKALELRDLWISQTTAGQNSTRIDVLHGLNMASLDAVGQAVFSCEFEALKSDHEPNEFASTMAQIFSMPNQKHVLVLMKNLFPALNFIIDPNMKLVNQAVDMMRGIGARLVAEKKARLLLHNAKDGGNSFEDRDFVSVLVKAHIKSDVPGVLRLSEDDVLSQFPTFIIAGHETASDATMWCLLQRLPYWTLTDDTCRDRSRLVVTLGRAHQNPSIYSDPDEPDRHRSRQGGPEPSNTESTPQTYAVDKDAKLVYYGGQQVFWKTDKWLFTEVALSWQQCLAIDPEYRKQYRDISLGDELPEEPAATPEPRRTEPEQHSPVDFTTPRPAQAEIIEESEPESENTTNRTPEEDPEEFEAAPEPVGKTPQEEPIRTEPTNEPEAKMAEERTNEIKLKMPPEFSGKRGEVVEWLQKCSLYLTMNKKTYADDEMKIVFCLMLMNGGTAGTWSRTFIEDVERQAADQNKNLREGENRVEPNYGTWDEFKKQLLDAFDDVDQKASARVLLRNLKQGSKKVEDYIAEFKSIISRC